MRIFQIKKIIVQRFDVWYRVFFSQRRHPEWPHVFRLFAQLIQARLTEVEALDLLVQWTKPPLKSIVSDVCHQVRSGKSLSEAFLLHAQHLPFYFLLLLHAGEKTHTLGETLAKGAVIGDENALFKKRLLSQSRYPLMLIALLGLVLVLYFFFFLPQLQSFYHSSGMDYTTHQGYFFWFISVLALSVGSLGAYIRICLRTSFHWVMALSYLSVLLRGGVRLADTLSGVAQHYHGTVLGRKFTQWSDHLQSGAQIADAFQKSGFQDDLTIKLLRSGAVTNQIGDTFKLSHQIHQAHFTHTLDKTMSTLQPALILIVAIVLCYMIFAFYFPFYDQLLLGIEQ